jgi:hypothetical protein
MLKNVEDSNNEKIEGYYFVDKDGSEFIVRISETSSEIVEISADDITSFGLYKKDIPRFIKVLEAAYAHEESV